MSPESDGLDHLSVGGKLIHFINQGLPVEKAAYLAGIRHAEARVILRRPMVQRALRIAAAKEREMHK